MFAEAYREKNGGIVNYCVQDRLFGGVTRFITEAVPKTFTLLREILRRSKQLPTAIIFYNLVKARLEAIICIGADYLRLGSIIITSGLF